MDYMGQRGNLDDYANLERSATFADSCLIDELNFTVVWTIFGLCSGKIYLYTVTSTVVALLVRDVLSLNSIFHIFSQERLFEFLVYLKICQ